MDTFEDFEVKKQFWDLKRKFREQCARQWPGVSYPEMPWILTEMGIDPKTVIAEPISRSSYIAFKYDSDGNRMYDAMGTIVRKRIKFTDEQRAILKEWWPLLPWEMRDE